MLTIQQQKLEVCMANSGSASPLSSGLNQNLKLRPEQCHLGCIDMSMRAA